MHGEEILSEERQNKMEWGKKVQQKMRGVKEVEPGVVLVSNRKELQRLMGYTATWEQNNSENKSGI